MTVFIFSLRKNGTLISSWFQSATWENIDAVTQQVRDRYPEDIKVECVEDEDNLHLLGGGQEVIESFLSTSKDVI